MNLKVERVKKGLTQEELSKKSRVSRYLISRAEHGDYGKISIEKMERIADALELSIEKLLME